jgi:nuclear transport factor 2 (NTF2) superfamily protein
MARCWRPLAPQLWQQAWEFDEGGLMRRREASINDIAIRESDRKFLAAPVPDRRTTPASPTFDSAHIHPWY